MAFTKVTAAGIGSVGTVTLQNVVVTGSVNTPIITGAASTENVRTNSIVVSGVSTFTSLTVGTGVTIQSGIVSATEYYASNQRRVVAFTVGTTTLFHQAAAPTGWTKSTTHNDKALRVVSGAGGGSGGSTAFSSVMASRTTGGSVSGSNSGGSVSNTTLSEAQMPYHQHGTFFNGADDTNPPRNIGNMTVWADNAPFSATAYSDYRGSSNAHGHGFTNPSWSGSFTGTAMDFAVQYIDIILCSID